jgi:arginyl-tRNA synthetase
VYNTFMKQEIRRNLESAILAWKKEKSLPDFKMPEILVDRPKDEKFGDYTTNVAMILALLAKMKPMEVAKFLAKRLTTYDLRRFAKIEAVEPGYVNFYLSPEYLQNVVAEISKKKEKFGGSNIGKNQKVLVEFISSNPTGPIHLGNGRGGPLGDTLANVLEKSGFKTEREFYVNDYGNQVEVLGHSILKDEDAQYAGDYINDLAEKKPAEIKDPLEIGNWAAGEILSQFIKPTCEKLGVKFNVWFLEKSLHDGKCVEGILEILKNKNLVYEKDGAVWLKSTSFGDDKDRVMVKSDGKKTYLATDFAYHKNKIERGFDKLISIQGADHHKEVEVVKYFIENVLGEKNKLDSILTQFVRVIQNGKEVKMSKRKGVYFALNDLIDEVGKDAARFIFLSYAPQTHINFDIDLAKVRSEKNPVYYVQYAHARIASISRKAQNAVTDDSQPTTNDNADLSLLTHEKELNLIKELNKFPELVEEIARTCEVHKLPHYVIKLADKFHNFYEECRVIDEKNPELSRARLNLVNAVRIVLSETLRLMGVSSPEKM